MLTILNNYAHGYVSIPVILTCKKHGLFNILNKQKPVPFDILVKELNANSGYLKVTLHMLESLKWILNNENNEYLLTNKASICYEIPENIIDLMTFPMIDYLNKNENKNSLRKWITLSSKRWNMEEEIYSEFLDGMLVMPLLLNLKKNNLLDNLDSGDFPLFSSLDLDVRKEITDLFLNQGWILEKNGVSNFTDEGRFIINRIFITATVASYTLMLTNISEVIFGDCKNVFERDNSDTESHVDRTLNVIGSGFQHEKYFSDMGEIILGIFNKEPVNEQPNYIADMGCGDGALLQKIYTVVKNKSLRGKYLDKYPLKMIGVDYNEKALEATNDRLKKTEIDYIVLNGDINDPVQMVKDLKKIGIKDTENILHVRSFLDHDRPFIMPEDMEAAKEYENIPSEAAYVDREGKLVPNNLIIQSLVEHLNRWASIISKHGLVILEVHCLDPKTVSKYVEKCENLHFDAYHRFSQQSLVEADKFLMAAAEIGLFPNQDSCRKYPKTLAFGRVTLNYFQKREYRGRYAKEKDIEQLHLIDVACWEEKLQTPVYTIRNRIKRYPEGQLVIEIDNEVVGVVYSQRINSVDDLKNRSVENVEELHDRNGNIVQLIGLNILPSKQHVNLGDQLLEFMLQKCSLMQDVQSIVGISRCKNYSKYSHMPIEDYITSRNENGRLLDFTLRFHELHGAKVKAIVLNYRIHDVDNLGNGVLIEYDVYNRKRKEIMVNKNKLESNHEVSMNKKKKIIEDFVEKTIVFILGQSKSEGYSLQRPLMEMGLDSADLLELNEQISSKYEISLKPTFFFKYKTPEAIISYLHEDITLKEGIIENKKVFELEENSVEYSENNERFNIDKKDVAIVGVSCRLPGGIKTKEQLWNLLEEGKNVIDTIPETRWNWPKDIDTKNKFKGIDLGAFLDDITSFEPSFFRISPKEAQLMDPQQRILLELTWECLEDSGYKPSKLYGSKTGIFVGACGSDYKRLLDKNVHEIGAHFEIGTSMAAIPNRISYFYNFTGPSIQMDTACSSSLVSIGQAVKSLQVGECKQALVGGINIMCYPANSIAYYKAGMLSEDGRCKTFDKEANGYVRGEGAVMLFLKPVEEALKDKDSIYGVIKSVAINHGGQSGGLTVPNPVKQGELIVDAYKKADIEVETVSYIEAHGTGTSLGDPIEINGLKDAFEGLSNKNITKPYCGIGSIKTNLGHLEAASGIVSLLKVLLSMQQKTLPASLNYNELNPNIDLLGTPFYVVDKKQPWNLQDGQKVRRAGVSNFGSGGTNAHVVLEEAPEIMKNQVCEYPYYLIALSAKTEEVLRQKEEDLLRWIKEEGKNSNLYNISSTLLLGREHFNVSASLIVKNMDELEEKLEVVLKKCETEGYYKYSSTEKTKEAYLEKIGSSILKELEIDKLSDFEYKKNIDRLGDLYAKGYDLEWNSLYSDDKRSFVNIPTYPFAKEHYWIPESSNNCTIANTTNITLPVVEDNILNEKMCYLKKAWKESYETSKNKLGKNIVILKNSETENLSKELAKYFECSEIIEITDIKDRNIQGRLKLKRYDYFVDLIGCGINRDYSMDWILWLQQLIEYGHKENLRVLCITKSLESYKNIKVNLAGATHAGLYRMLQSEYGQLISRHMDVEKDIDDIELVRDILFELALDNKDIEVCYRKDKRYTAYLKEYPLSNGKKSLANFSGNEVLWITGGARGLGYLCAEYFVKNYGVKKLVLTGREEIPLREEWDYYMNQNNSISEKIKSIKALEDKGVQVKVLSVPLQNQYEMEKAMEEVKRTMGYISAIIHCAGIDDKENSAFIRKSMGAINKVLEPKIAGLDTIYNTFKNEPLKFFVVFSSVAAIIPSLASGKSDYSLANSYMDYFAEAKNSNCPIRSIQWPNWKETGMGEVKGRSYKETGLLSHSNEEGLKLLDYVISNDLGPVVLPAVVNFDLWKPEELMNSKIKVSYGNIENNVVDNTFLPKNVDTLANETRKWLTSLISKELKMDSSKINIQTPFQDYGIDSIFLSQIMNSINQRIKAELDSSILYEYSTIDSFTNWLINNYADSLFEVFGIEYEDKYKVESKNEVDIKHDKKEMKNKSDIAVVGLSCCLPGANNLDEYWNLLLQGKSAITFVGEERFGENNNYYAGLIDSIKDFDSKFFFIPEEDAKAMDPQALVLLEESLKLWYHAGYSHEEVKGKSIGVYIGGRSNHKAEDAILLKAKNPILAYGQNYLAANISQFFDLRGPSIVLDTACSSSLVVMHMAIQALENNEIESALIGGVNVFNSDEYHKIFKQRGILNPDPYFHAFDGRANGVVLGEGVGMILLKTLDKAFEDGDNIYAVIKGTAINNDGRTAGPATPNIQAQKEVMETALYNSGHKAEEINYIEANASGSEVTDLLELKAIQGVYRADNNLPLALGSVKPNIGHLLCAEGITSLIKVILMLNHKKVVPYLSGEEPIKHFDLQLSPFYFCREVNDWIGSPIVAAVNCFADGGTNVHLILESFEEKKSRKIKRHPIEPPMLNKQGIKKDKFEFKRLIDINNPIFYNHRVYRQPLLPGLAYIDMLYRVFVEKGYDYNLLELSNLTIYSPLTVAEDYNVRLTISCSKTENNWKIKVEGQKESKGILEVDKKLYVTAEMKEIAPVTFDETIDLYLIKKNSDRVIDMEELYKRCRSEELVHTGFIKAEGKVYKSKDCSLVDININKDILDTAGEYIFHPTLIDASAVASGLFPTSFNGEDSLFLPLHYESFKASAVIQKHCITRIKAESVFQRKELLYLTMEFFDEEGRKVGELRKFINKLVREAGLINPDRKEENINVQQVKQYVQKPEIVYRESENINTIETIEKFLKEIMAEKLGIEIEAVDSNIGYYEMGLTSNVLLQVVTSIENKLKENLSPTLLFEYTTISEFSDYIAENYSDKFGVYIIESEGVKEEKNIYSYEEIIPKSKGDKPINSKVKMIPQVQDIAIIGMSGRYPGAKNLKEFWTNLTEAKDCITEVPKSRWDWHELDGLQSPLGKKMSHWGGFIDEVDCFDPQFFRISPREAEMIDPQERLFLETCWETIEDAGYTPKNIVKGYGPNKRRPVGVFAGVMHKDYIYIGAEQAGNDELFPMSLNYAQIPNRVSYFCNFHGPSMAIDTVCSSSLTAIHLAAESIRHGECEVALAGGVNLSLHPLKYKTYGMMDLHSSDGHCNTFGKSGDGYVSAEGIGAVLLKPLDKAIEDGDNIYAVIKGSVINHVGTVSGITVPSPVAQAYMIAECLEKTGINPRTISYVEAHGTGTSLGDPIEIQGLAKAYRKYTDDKQFCAIGSVKSNIGHAESASGISGLHKVALNLYNTTLVPSLHSDELNPYIDFEKSPFYVQHKTEHWEQPTSIEDGKEVKYPRRAAISSFGATGSNAHIILEEYVKEESRNSVNNNPVLINLSAKNKERLEEYAGKLLDFLKLQDNNEEPNIDIEDRKASYIKILEDRICNILSKFLHLHDKDIEVEETWSEYGIDNVQLVQVADRFREEFKVEFNIYELSKYSSISSVVTILLDKYDLISSNYFGDYHDSEIHKESFNNKNLSLTSLAYTLQVGRAPMDERISFIVKDVKELNSKLEAFIKGEKIASNFYYGNIKANKNMTQMFSLDEDFTEVINKWLIKRKLGSLADLWTKGLDIDWQLLYGEDNKPNRVSIPTYPFAKEHYWVPNGKKKEVKYINKEITVENRQIKYLQKVWKEKEITNFNNISGIVAIYYNNTTEKLAMLLAKYYENVVLLKKGHIEDTWNEKLNRCAVWLDIAEFNEDSLSLESIPYLQKLIKNRDKNELRLINVTKGMELLKNESVNMYGAGLSAVFKVLQSEYFSVISRHVDLDIKEENLEAIADIINKEIEAETNICEVCYRDGKRYESTFNYLDLSKSEKRKISFSDDDVVIVTGGTRGLGMLCAKYMVKKYGIKKLVLIGREDIPDRSQWINIESFSPSMQEKIKSIKALEKQGVIVRNLAVHLQDVERVKAEIDGIETSMGHIKAVIHAAGLADTENPAFIYKDTKSIEKILSPKVYGTRNLMDCFEGKNLEFFILFSSVAAAIPTLGVGQSDYAMANSYMDYYAQVNNSKLPIISVQWPSWKETGFGEIKNQAYINTGLNSITDDEGLYIFDEILEKVHEAVVMPVVVSDMQWNPDKLINKNTKIKEKSVKVKESSDSDVTEVSLEFLKPLFERELRLKENELDIESDLYDFGVDSIIMAQILQKINKELDIKIDPSILFEHSTLKSFAEWFGKKYIDKLDFINTEKDEIEEVENLEETKEVVIKPIVEIRKVITDTLTNNISPKEEIVVVGMASRFPGGESLEEYWRLLAEGRCAIKKVPENRWSKENDYYAALIDDIYSIDYNFFKLTKEDVKEMDAQALVLLQESLKAIYHAGYTCEEVSGSKVGVYIGARKFDNMDISKIKTATNVARVSGQNYLATNISQFFNFTGPSFVIDSACSSSLVAMQVAVDALRGGSLKAALVGGISLLTNSETHELFKCRNLLQKDDKFHILDRRASGVVLGEGCGVVILKTLSQAKKDGDKIYAVINGISVNNDGKTVSATSPNIETQKEVMKVALEESRCLPNEIDYVEINGSGSEVTDLLELKEIEAVYRKDKSKTLYLGSIKPNIAHPLCAKGIASFIKVVMMLDKQTMLPFISGEEPLEYYSLEEANFKLPRKMQPEEINYASINCFADGGTNVNVVVGIYNDDSNNDLRSPLSIPEMKPVHLRDLQPISNKESIVLENRNTSITSSQLLSVDNEILKNHKVFNEEVLPGFAWIDFIYKAYSKEGYKFNELKLKNLSIYNPLIVKEGNVVKVKLEGENKDKDFWNIQVTGSNGSEDKELNYVSAEMELVKSVQFNEVVNLEKSENEIEEKCDIEEFYLQYVKRGLVHSEIMKTKGYVLMGDSENWIYVSSDETIIQEEFLFNTALIDGSVVAISGALLKKEKDDSKLYLPLYYESFYVQQLLEKECYIRVKNSNIVNTSDLITLTLEYFNCQGCKIGELKNLKIKSVRNKEFLNINKDSSRKNEDVQPLNDIKVSNKSFKLILKSIITLELNIDEEEVRADKGYYDLGLDSLMLLHVSKELSNILGVKLSPTLLFEYSTITKLCEYLEKEYPKEVGCLLNASNDINKEVKDLENKKDAVIITEYRSKCNPMDVAVIGMAGRYPKAENIDEFWKNLCDGIDCVTEVPSERWDSNCLNGVKSPSGRNMSKCGGFIKDVDCFDAEFFDIPAEEAVLMDPQERQFLEICWQAIENSGYTPENIVTPVDEFNRRKVGIFVGVMHHDYEKLQKEESNEPIIVSSSSIANRVSYICDFQGPSMAIDTVCASSLTAIHLALLSIYSGESKVAIAGGVNLSLHPSKYEKYGRMDMHSSDGICHSFGVGGDGYISSEGVGAVILKPLKEAIEDKDDIYAVIKSSSINHVGKSSGMHVPSPVAEASVVKECLDRGNIDPETIGYVEAHATGTLLGDSIEVNALTKVYGKYTKSKGYCALGSVKSNIGHAESAAGISAVTRTILQLYNKKLLNSLHCNEVNPYLNLAESPFYIPDHVSEWSKDKIHKGQVRRAAVSSFGATGSNAHMILEEASEFRKVETCKEEKATVLIPVSAKSENALKEYIAKLAKFISENKDISLLSFAYTLQNGRSAFEERFITLADSLDKVYTIFNKYLNGEEEIENTWYGSSDESVKDNNLLKEDELDKIAQLWVHGYSIEWNKLYVEKPGKMHLPTYPFSKKSYWIEDKLKVKEENKQKRLENKDNFNEDDIIFVDGDEVQIDNYDEIELNVKEKALLFCKKLVSKVLNISVKEVKNDDVFMHMGLSSVAIVNMASEISNKIDKNIMPSYLFDYTTVSKLAEFLASNYSSALDKLILTKEYFSPKASSDFQETNNKEDKVIDKRLINAMKELEKGSLDIEDILRLMDE